MERKNVKINLGSKYEIWWSTNYFEKKINCIFIQPTKCGFNFLNEKTFKCELKHHLYPNKKICDRRGEQNWFLINSKMNIKEINNEYN